jgi:hypothetical protein
MIYAIHSHSNKWTILRGRKGCVAGDGEILERNVDEAVVQTVIIKYEQAEKKKKKESNPFSLGK